MSSFDRASVRFRGFVSAIAAGAALFFGAMALPAVAEDPPKPDSAKFLTDTNPVTGGLLTLHKGEDKLLLELQAGDYKNEYLVLISIARGVGLTPLLGGYSWSFGDDWVWQFRKVGDRVFVVRKNVRFKAKDGTPEATAVSKSYNDSVLYALPILAKGPNGGDLVDLDSVFMSDLPQISQVLPGGFQFSRARSTLGDVKTFENNVELEVEATYGSQGTVDIDSVPDTRGVTMTVHYSVSKLPTTDYKPRLADDRIGYFLTVRKDFSKSTSEEPFVRYVNRWNLQKAEPDSDLSPPKKPIVFWIENTVPFKYRRPVSDAILEWNTAFEKAGFSNAVEVRQQPEKADWYPEDVNYNTFRWITSSAGFAQGPSRVNPYTGQILDADIIFDADFLISWKRQFEIFSAEEVNRMTGGTWLEAGVNQNIEAPKTGVQESRLAKLRSQGMVDHRDFYAEKSKQFLLGRTALIASAKPETDSKAEEDKLIYQGLKEVVMHEVGHTLGLRHNFKASTWKTLEEMNKGGDEPLVASVMDYTPTNIMPASGPQGQYYMTKLGPYDMWAIEYGYKEYGDTGAEKKGLAKIASLSGEPGHAFSTDEDTTGESSDPTTNRFDLGAKPLDYAKSRLELMRDLAPKLRDKLVDDGEDYSQARQAFNTLLSQYGQSIYFASRYVGGVEINRSHKGDKDGPAPTVTVPVEQQREVLDFLQTKFLSEDAFPVPKDLYAYLAPSRWNHWGMEGRPTPDFRPVDVLGMWQERVISQLLSTATLEQAYGAELRAAEEDDVITTAELIQRVTQGVFSETETLGEWKPPAKPEPADEAKPEDAKPEEKPTDEAAAEAKPEDEKSDDTDDNAESDESTDDDAKSDEEMKDGDPQADEETSETEDSDEEKAAEAKPDEPKADEPKVEEPQAEEKPVEAKPAPEGYSTRNPAIGALRRNLQRATLTKLGTIAMGDTGAPQDCQAIAKVELEALKGRVGALLAKDYKLDAYTIAHLREIAIRIQKILDAEMTTGL